MKHRAFACLLLMMWSVLGAVDVLAQDHVTWHAPGWKYRAIVLAPAAAGKEPGTGPNNGPQKAETEPVGNVVAPAH